MTSLDQQFANVVNRHLSAWAESDPSIEGAPTLSSAMQAMVAECLALNSLNWQAGNETLRHERDILQDRVDNLEARGIHTCHDHCQRPLCVAHREKRALQAELVQLNFALGLARKDRERLDWLDQHKPDLEYRHNHGELGPGWSLWTEDRCDSKHSTVREAIDSARQREKGEA